MAEFQKVSDANNLSIEFYPPTNILPKSAPQVLFSIYIRLTVHNTTALSIYYIEGPASVYLLPSTRSRFESFFMTRKKRQQK